MNTYNYLRGVCGALMLAIAALGCATTGAKVDSNQVSKIVQGQTTKEEVRNLLGKPITVSRNGTGAETWVYSYDNFQQKCLGQGIAMVGVNSIGAFLPIPGLSAAGAVGSAAMATKQPSFKYQSAMITFNAEGVVTAVDYQETTSQ